MREMKDSGIEWIGEIPKDWEITKIGMLYNLRITKVSDTDYLPLSVTKMGVLPQLETVAKTNAHDDRKLVKKGDFVINSRSDRRGSCGISNYNGSVSLINTVLEPKNNMNSGYYSWLFKTVQFADEFYKNGHGIVDDLWTTGWQDMKRIVLPVPQYSEQQQITDFLDTQCSEIDATAEDIQKEISLLEDYKKSVITEAVTKGLNPDAEMKDSGIEWLGKVPTNWNFSRVLYNIKFEGGSQPPLTEFVGDYREGYIRLIQNRDYKTDAYKVYVPKKSVSKFCDEEDIMVGRYGPPLFVIHKGLKGAYNVALMKAVPIGINKQFMYYFLHNSTMLNYIESFSKRTAGQSGVNPEILKKYPMFYQILVNNSKSLTISTPNAPKSTPSSLTKSVSSTSLPTTKNPSYTSTSPARKRFLLKIFDTDFCLC